MGNDLMLPIAEGREDQGIFQGETGAVSSSRTPMARNRRRSHHPANLGDSIASSTSVQSTLRFLRQWTCVHRNYVASENESDAAKIDISRSGSQQLASQ